MSEQNEAVSTEVKVETPPVETPEVKQEVQQQVSAPEYSPAEELAMSRGWLPKEDWEANPDNAGKKWRDAEEFLERGELFDRIHQLNRKTAQTEQALNNLSKHHKRVYESAYNKAMRDLKAQRSIAIREGDGDMLNAVEDQMEAVKKQYEEDVQNVEASVPKAGEAGPNPQFVAWVNQNPWFMTHPEVRAYAEIEGIKYARSNPNVQNTDVWNHVAKKVREKFPEVAPRNPNRDRAPEVEGTSTVRRPTKKADSDGYVLSEDEERVARNFERTGVMTRKEYIEELKSLSKGK